VSARHGIEARGRGRRHGKLSLKMNDICSVSLTLPVPLWSGICTLNLCCRERQRDGSVSLPSYSRTNLRRWRIIVRLRIDDGRHAAVDVVIEVGPVEVHLRRHAR
jgi:hypothetical protein